jgi:hypothetical protein
MAQLSHSAYVRNLTHRFGSFMAIDRKVSAPAEIPFDALFVTIRSRNLVLN